MTELKHFGGIEFNMTNGAWRKLSVPIGAIVHITISYRNAVMFDQNVIYAESFGYLFLLVNLFFTVAVPDI